MRYPDLLRKYIQAQQADRPCFYLRVQDLKQITNDTLPKSAYLYNAWWANGENSHNHNRIWLDSGYRARVIREGNRIIIGIEFYRINLTDELEDSTTYRIRPKWNSLDKNKLDIDKEQNINKSTLIKHKMANKENKTFEITLWKTYYNKGFFNVSIKYSDNFGADKAVIKIQLGNSSNVLQGKINRTANNNGTPRIICGRQLSDWIQKLIFRTPPSKFEN